MSGTTQPHSARYNCFLFVHCSSSTQETYLILLFFAGVNQESMVKHRKHSNQPKSVPHYGTTHRSGENLASIDCHNVLVCWPWVQATEVEGASQRSDSWDTWKLTTCLVGLENGRVTVTPVSPRNTPLRQHLTLSFFSSICGTFSLLPCRTKQTY